jgi:tRNA uridine 5-carboxymethylaminomethyl modification enzyme
MNVIGLRWEQCRSGNSGTIDGDPNGSEVPTPAPARTVTGIIAESGEEIGAGAVILTTGTFLDGKCHVGLESFAGGRGDEPPSVGLGDCLARAGFECMRLKTGTPPRLAGDSVDLSVCEPQPGDEVPTPFSLMTDAIDREQIPCHLTWTSERTHDLIRGGLDRSPLHAGIIQGVGPRYCPSIEDKVVRFPERPHHHVFLEPDDFETGEIYPNGVSTSLPRDVQIAFLQTIRGLEQCVITRPGYAVEYTFFPPTQLWPSLETKRVEGLFFAGQINGTSGYEEAAAQGIVAGVNAALLLGGGEPVVLRRDEAYIGVLIDDLVTKGTREPYRMFTSRAEHRLLLAHHTADERLTPLGRRLGLVDDGRWARFELLADLVARVRGGEDSYPANGSLLRRAQERVDLDRRYSGYIRREQKAAERLRALEGKAIPADFDYARVRGLSCESLEKLSALRPKTIGQATRVPGIRPPDVALVAVMIRAGAAVQREGRD